MPNVSETKQLAVETDEVKHSFHELTSPEVDELVQIATDSGGAGGTRLWGGFSFHEHTSESKSEDLFPVVERVYDLLSRIQPETEGSDTIWSLWLRTERVAILNERVKVSKILDGATFCSEPKRPNGITTFYLGLDA